MALWANELMIAVSIAYHNYTAYATGKQVLGAMHGPMGRENNYCITSLR